MKARIYSVKNSVLRGTNRILRRLGIYKRLAVSFTAVVLISGVIITVVSTYLGTRTIDENIEKSTSLVLTDLNNVIGVMLDEYESLANQAAKDSGIKELLIKCRSLIENDPAATESEGYLALKMEIGQLLYGLAGNRGVSNISIVTSFDEFMQYRTISSVQQPYGASLADGERFRTSPQYREAIAMRGTLSWWDTSKETCLFWSSRTPPIALSNHLTLTRSIPYFQLEDSLGVIVITVPITRFRKITDIGNAFDSNELFLLASPTGTTVVLNTVHSTRQIEKMPDESIYARLPEEQGGKLTYEKNNNQMVLYTLPCTRLNHMTLVYMAEKRVIYSMIYQLQRIIILVCIVCCTLSLLVSYFVTKSISLPLRALNATMKKIETGGLNFEYTDPQQDEVSQLGQGFNHMIGRIKALLRDLLEQQRINQETELKKTEAQLDALQMQINPHFMYNTMDLIRWSALMEAGYENQTSKMLLAYSNLLRFNTKNMDKTVELSEEIRHVRAYATVLNFKENLNVVVETEIPAELLCSCRIPKLTLQPLAENAVKHGVTNEMREIRIRISAVRTPKGVVVKVRDNGTGMPAPLLDKLNTELAAGQMSGGSIGLRNVNERLRLYFGRHSGLRLFSLENLYTEVRMFIPCSGEPAL